MGRRAIHDTSAFLDAAVRLFADSGTAGVTMSAVAKETGAPSGSVYHRFADRPALLAALWLRTVRRFQQGYLREMARADPLDAAVAATKHVVLWCRDNPGEAMVLHAGKRALGEPEWSVVDRESAGETDRVLESSLRPVLHGLRDATGRDTEELLLILVDLPYAAVRRYLTRGQAPPPRTAKLVADAARTLLAERTTS